MITAEAETSDPTNYDTGYQIDYGYPGAVEFATWTTYRPSTTYDLRLTVSDVIGHTTTFVETWTVSLVDECSDFIITSNAFAVSDFTFVMGQTAQTVIALDLNTGSCDTTYSLEYKTVASDSYIDFTVSATEVLTDWDNAGSFKIFADSSSTVYNTYSPLQLFYIRMKATNTLSTSGNTYSESFVVTFEDLCTSNTLTESQS